MAEILLEQIRKILDDVAPGTSWADVGADADLEDAGLDSLDKATAVLKVEELSGVTIPDEDYDGISSMQDIITYVSTH